MTSLFDLPFHEIWAIDTEYYPGPGYANGGRDGDRITPLALVAIEMRTGRTVRLWQDELGPAPPYRLDPDVLVISYMATAEMGFHLAAGWGQPACLLDCYIEFRRITNDARVTSKDEPGGLHRDKGFYSLAGALRFFREDEIDLTRKDETRDRILQGAPFSSEERCNILEYCEDDTRALARLARHLIPTIRSLPHALYRGQYARAIARQERRGVPIDLPQLERIRERWAGMKTSLVAAADREYGCYEIESGEPHFRDELFRAYVRRQRIPWPEYPDGSLDKRTETFRDMAASFPQVDGLRELRSTLSQLRLNDLSVGRDSRNRCLIGPFGTKTGRNAPSNSKFVFGPAKWIRFLIAPEPGTALIHRDFSQQEVWIAAVLSGDAALLAACLSGDVYLGIATRLNLAPADATAQTHPQIRKLFKTVTLGIQYGLGPRSLALRTGISRYEAGEIIARLRAEFRGFEAWSACVADHAGLDMLLSTPFGWTMRCPPGTNPRTIRNWPIQACGAAILHAACILAERRGMQIVAPIHDALLAEAPVADVDNASLELDRVMRDASRLVLRGCELPTSGGEPILPGQRYFDERGEQMWNTINRLLEEQ
jgi:DNA polymerase family A